MRLCVIGDPVGHSLSPRIPGDLWRGAVLLEAMKQ